MTESDIPEPDPIHLPEGFGEACEGLRPHSISDLILKHRDSLSQIDVEVDEYFHEKDPEDVADALHLFVTDLIKADDFELGVLDIIVIEKTLLSVIPYSGTSRGEVIGSIIASHVLGGLKRDSKWSGLIRSPYHHMYVFPTNLEEISAMRNECSLIVKNVGLVADLSYSDKFVGETFNLLFETDENFSSAVGAFDAILLHSENESRRMGSF